MKPALFEPFGVRIRLHHFPLRIMRAAKLADFQRMTKLSYNFRQTIHLRVGGYRKATLILCEFEYRLIGGMIRSL
jgi:hypothetical protein